MFSPNRWQFSTTEPGEAGAGWCWGYILPGCAAKVVNCRECFPKKDTQKQGPQNVQNNAKQLYYAAMSVQIVPHHIWRRPKEWTSFCKNSQDQLHQEEERINPMKATCFFRDPTNPQKIRWFFGLGTIFGYNDHP